MEGQGRQTEAAELFQKAWHLSGSDQEKFVAAHYVARHQNSVAEKLQWDETALEYAQKLDIESIKSYLPSLHLNVGKCHEDLGRIEEAARQYQLANSMSCYLGNDGYGTMIKHGISAALSRLESRF